MPPPRLTFFVELSEEKLEQLFQPAVIDLLAGHNAAISMAILDLSPRRQQVVRALNQAKVPVTAWLVLDEKEGYWLTADNAAIARRRYEGVKDWSSKVGVDFDAIGLDIETPHQDALSLVREGKDALLRMLLGRRERQVVLQATRCYQQLVQRIQKDGLRVESYQFPPIVDERQAQSTLLQRVFGLVDVVPDREVLMLYRSILPGPLGSSLVDTYGAEADAIAVGITGGGVPFLNPIATHLTLQTLLEELRRARRYTQHLYVFSLEGCVAGDYLKPLFQANLEQETRPSIAAPLGRAARAGLRGLLRAENLLDRLYSSSSKQHTAGPDGR